MSQQPYFPPAPQQGYPDPNQPYALPLQQPMQPQAPVYPQQYAPQQYGQPAPQQYGQPMGQPGQVPSQPLAQGGLDEFYSQPTAGGGPGITWQDKAGNKKPLGTTYVGVVARDVTHGDVQQQTNPQGMPQYFRDGRPKFQMKVPLKSVMIGDGSGQYGPSPEFPDGEAAWYVRGQARDELTRAMAEAGVEGAPKAGSTIVVTLVQRRPSGAGFQPANIVQVRYIPADGAAGAAQVPAQAPVQPATSVEQPVAHPVAQPQVQQFQQPQVVQPRPGAQPQPVQVQQQYQQPPVQQQAAPVQQPAAQPAGQPLGMPADFSPAQQELMARLTGQPASGQPAA